MVRKADLLLRGDKAASIRRVDRHPSQQKIERKLTVYLKKQFTLPISWSLARSRHLLEEGDDLWTYTPNVRKSYAFRDHDAQQLHGRRFSL